jgi:ATP-dependent exoDNAse (exonuclease V) beta subunit
MNEIPPFVSEQSMAIHSSMVDSPIVIANENDNFCNVRQLAKEAVEKMRNIIREVPKKEHFSDDISAISYGNWWHETMHYFPWTDDYKEWEHYVATCVSRAPQKRRAIRELKEFCKSSLCKFLCTTFHHFYGEWEFYQRKMGSGIIDLLCVNEEANLLCVVDWKTDSSGTGTMEESHEKQLIRYVNFLRQGKNRSEKFYAAIYYTSRGETIFLPGHGL